FHSYHSSDSGNTNTMPRTTINASTATDHTWARRRPRRPFVGTDPPGSADILVGPSWATGPPGSADVPVGPSSPLGAPTSSSALLGPTAPMRPNKGRHISSLDASL